MNKFTLRLSMQTSLSKANRHAQLLKQLQLICSTGHGIALLAPSIAAITRQIIGAEACVVVWVNELGYPMGMFHENALPTSTDLFLNHYDRLFATEHEMNASWLARHNGSPVAQLMNPSADYLQSNSYNLLARADGYHHLLDLRIDSAGKPRAILALFRHQGKPFNESDARILLSLLPILEQAVRPEVASLSAMPIHLQHSSAIAGYLCGHMLVSADAQQVDMLDDASHQMLRSTHLVGQELSIVGSIRQTPKFIRELCVALRTERQQVARNSLDISGGQLRCEASWMSTTHSHPLHDGTPFAAQSSPLGAPSGRILVTLHYLPSAMPQVVQSIMSLSLSPLQSRIALYAAQGGSRIECASRHQVSKVTLRTHLRQIYAAAECDSWDALSSRLVLPM
jgi:DNA-binding CsgD family transcriptional regulator